MNDILDPIHCDTPFLVGKSETRKNQMLYPNYKVYEAIVRATEEQEDVFEQDKVQLASSIIRTESYDLQQTSENILKKRLFDELSPALLEEFKEENKSNDFVNTVVLKSFLNAIDVMDSDENGEDVSDIDLPVERIFVGETKNTIKTIKISNLFYNSYVSLTKLLKVFGNCILQSRELCDSNDFDWLGLLACIIIVIANFYSCMKIELNNKIIPLVVAILSFPKPFDGINIDELVPAAEREYKNRGEDLPSENKIHEFLMELQELKSIEIKENTVYLKEKICLSKKS